MGQFGCFITFLNNNIESTFLQVLNMWVSQICNEDPKAERYRIQSRWSAATRAVSSADGSLRRGTKWTAFTFKHKTTQKGTQFITWVLCRKFSVRTHPKRVPRNMRLRQRTNTEMSSVSRRLALEWAYSQNDVQKCLSEYPSRQTQLCLERR